ncbi:MAG: TRAP transporter small permease [Desulfobacteraceae bacterium]|nr:TRAP transporter small permease [Desulfobacteraceae bacterium]
MSKIRKTNNLFKDFIDGASFSGGVIASFCLLFIALAISYEALMRYVFGAPTIWVKEVSVYLCIAIGFLGAAWALKTESHFSITIVVDLLKPQKQRILKIITHTMGILYSCVFIYKGVTMVIFSYQIEDISSGLLEVPLWIPEILLPCGGLLLALQFFKKLVEEITSNPKQEF